MRPDVAFVEGTVSVSVPATSANLGPGFDCLGIALELADTLGVDLEAAIHRKLAKNEEKYPVSKARGSSKKYTDL